MPILFDLFVTFAKVGVCTFGGGIAMLPILEREVVSNKGWATMDELIGNKHKGIPGSICATLGMIFPSLVIILIIASVLSNFADIPAVQSAFAGIRVCVCVLIFNAIIKLWKSVVKDMYSLICVLAVFLLSIFLDISPVIFVLLSAVRHVLDLPRPFEVYDLEPLLPRETPGRGFPSRHVFSIFVIGTCFCYLEPWLGWTLLGLGAVLSALRVLSAVHFERDVLVGAAAGILSGVIGFGLI